MKGKLDDRLPVITSWNSNEGSVLIASTLTLRRNLAPFLFTRKLDQDKKKQVLSLLSQKLLTSQLLHEPRLIQFEDCSPLDKEWLQEHFFLSDSFMNPTMGEGFLLDHQGRIGALFNIEDHLQLKWFGVEEKLEEGWSTLSKLDDFLQNSFRFSFSPKWGFLTHLPHQSGTGLEISALLQVPALTFSKEEWNRLTLKENRFEFLPFASSKSEDPSSVILIRNRSSIGLTEQSLINKTELLIQRLTDLEKKGRIRLMEKDSRKIKDKICRQFGLLTYSYQLEVDEAVEAISWMKVGLDLGWIKGIDRKRLNELLFGLRRAHLTSKSYPPSLGIDQSREEISTKRATFTKEQFKGVELGI